MLASRDSACYLSLPSEQINLNKAIHTQAPRSEHQFLIGAVSSGGYSDGVMMSTRTTHVIPAAMLVTVCTAVFLAGMVSGDDPVLSLFDINPDETVYPDDLVNVTVVYTDADDDAPGAVWACVNDCSDNRTLAAADWEAGVLSDGDYTNGELFFLVNTFPVGDHTLTGGAHDTFTTSNSVSSDLTVRDDTPRLSNATVSPSSGGTAASFNFTVVFTDFDSRSGSVSVNVGTASHAMSANGDGDTSNGEEFYWNGTVAWGSHSFNFSADNGLNDAVNLSGGSVISNDAPDISDGNVVRVADDFTFSVNASDINTGDTVTAWTDIADHGQVALTNNGDGTFSATVAQSALISIGGDRTATFTTEDSLGHQTLLPGAETFVVDIVAGLTLTADSDAESGPPGGVDYTLTINNTGNHDDTFSLSHTSAQGWTFAYPATVTVPRAGSVQATVTVTVLFLAPGVVDAESVTATSGNNGSVALTLSQSTTVTQVYEVTVTAVTGTQEGAPDSSTSHVFQVQNTGNGADTFAISTGGGSWSSSASSSSLALTMGQVALVTVTHGVPTGAAYGDGDTVTLTAAGGGGASDSASADSSAGLVRSATITLDDSAGATDPGGNLLIRGNLTNTGNGVSSYGFGIIGDSAANGWAELNATSVTLAADTSMPFNIWISVPEDTPAAGSYDITVQVHGFESNDTATFTITSNARGASVGAAETSFRLNPGTSATTEVTVTNTGTVATDYTLVVDSGHDYVRFSTTSFNIAKGGFQVIDLTVIVPSDASGALSAGFTVKPVMNEGSSASQTISISPNLPQDTSGWAIDTAGVDSNTQFTFTLTGLAGDFTIDWDFGDSSAVRSDGGLSQSHSYSASGAATVSLTVTDDLGQVTSFSSGFAVTNVPPAVNKPSVSAEGDTAVDGNSVTTVEGTEVEFVLTIPTDTDGSLTLLRVAWGDETHRAYSGGDLSGPTLNLKHTYWKPGTYQVSVTAVDNSGDETVVQAQEITVRGDHTVLEEGTNQLGLLLLLAVFGLALSATAYHIRKKGFTGDETMNEQERARLSTLEQSMDTVREREELLEVAAYDAARVTTKLEDHLSAFKAILVKAQEVAAQETLSKLEAEEAAAAAAETQRELDLTEPDLELLAERFHGTLGKLVETRTELGTIEEQLAYVLKMERDEQFEKLTELTESYESTRRKIEALESVRTAREQAREESNLMDLLSSKGPAVAEDDFSFADDDYEGDDDEEFEVEIYEDEDGSFYYIDPDSGEEVPCDEDGNSL